MKFGYYAPTPWGDFYELRIDTTKVFPAGIDIRYRLYYMVGGRRRLNYGTTT